VANCFDYPTDLDEKYFTLEELGSGSFGRVYCVMERDTGRHFACKSIPKIPPNQSRTNSHNLLKIRSEVECMYKLGASLDAVFLKVGHLEQAAAEYASSETFTSSTQDVFEDERAVHLAMELCEGGSLLDRATLEAFTEMEVAQIMRSVLRFLAQCHSKGLFYRDVKPENFLYKDGESDVLKATDFGLMIKWDEMCDPPLTHPAGTPIYIAPEVAGKCYGSKADIYSAGVMCFQLLTGRYPYWPTMDFKPPTMSELFRIIQNRDIDFDLLAEEGVSPMAVDFLEQLLEKDPVDRPTANVALQHPWVKDPWLGGMAPSTALDGTVVQRLQRFAVNSQLKQIVLSTMASEMLSGSFDMTTSQTFIVTNLQELFERIDCNHSGDVTAKELLVGCSRRSERGAVLLLPLTRSPEPAGGARGRGIHPHRRRSETAPLADERLRRCQFGHEQLCDEPPRLARDPEEPAVGGARPAGV